MVRFIGIRHRVKVTAGGEERPTMVAIREGGKISDTFQLKTETDELDFLLTRFPTEYRPATDGEDLSQFLSRHIRRTKARGEQEGETVRVPSTFDGLREGDMVAMLLGGSGDRFAFALSRRGEEIGAKVLRIPPFILKEWRGDKEPDDDHLLLAELCESVPDLFYEVTPRAREYILMREAFRAYRFAMKDRIRCVQRLRQRVIGEIFLSPEGKYPEGLIEDIFDAQKANDRSLQSLLVEEEVRRKEVFRAVPNLDVWERILEGVPGMGERIAAGLLSGAGEIMRFYVEPDYAGAVTSKERQYRRRKAMERGAAKLKKMLGVHVLPDGTFPRKRHGQVANWVGEARQSLYLLGDQFNRRPATKWGQDLLRYKASMRAKHPRQAVEGKVIYSDAHIHKMALWRTLTRFVEWLFFQWMKLELERREQGT